MHQPSPMSTTPAFSPGGTITLGPLVGKRLRCTREDLYEQCSDHITLKMPSSVMFGSRSRTCFILVNSSAVRLCCLSVSAVMAVSVLISRKIVRKTKQKFYRV